MGRGSELIATESSHSSPKKMKYVESLASKPVEELVLKPVGGINAACNCNATTTNVWSVWQLSRFAAKLKPDFFFLTPHCLLESIPRFKKNIF